MLSGQLDKIYLKTILNSWLLCTDCRIHRGIHLVRILELLEPLITKIALVETTSFFYFSNFIWDWIRLDWIYTAKFEFYDQLRLSIKELLRYALLIMLIKSLFYDKFWAGVWKNLIVCGVSESFQNVSVVMDTPYSLDPSSKLIFDPSAHF